LITMDCVKLNVSSVIGGALQLVSAAALRKIHRCALILISDPGQWAVTRSVRCRTRIDVAAPSRSPGWPADMRIGELPDISVSERSATAVVCRVARVAVTAPGPGAVPRTVSLIRVGATARRQLRRSGFRSQHQS
jgi:hypothetical protein